MSNSGFPNPVGSPSVTDDYSLTKETETRSWLSIWPKRGGLAIRLPRDMASIGGRGVIGRFLCDRKS